MVSESQTKIQFSEKNPVKQINKRLWPNEIKCIWTIIDLFWNWECCAFFPSNPEV